LLLFPAVLGASFPKNKSDTKQFQVLASVHV